MAAGNLRHVWPGSCVSIPFHWRDQAHHLARNEGGPPVPPGRQRATGITPQGVPSRPREEAISLAQHEAPPPSQARRGPGAAMVLSQFGCHRSPFGSFPREGKNAPHISRCAKESRAPREGKNAPHIRGCAKEPRAQQAQPKAHHLARNEGGPPVPPDRQRTTGITPPAVPSRPREEANSLAQQEAPPPKPSDEGAGGSHGAVSIWLPPVALWFFPASGKEQPRTSADVQRNPAPHRRDNPASGGQETPAPFGATNDDKRRYLP